MQTALYSTIEDVGLAQQDACNGVTMGLVLTLRVSGSSETFHVLIQDQDYQRFMALQASPPPTDERLVALLRSKGFPEEQIRHALAGDGQELHSMLE